MHKDIPVTNTSKMPLHVGGFTILPGETRILPAHHVPEHLRPELKAERGEAPVETSPEPPDGKIAAAKAVEEILAHKVSEIAEMLPSMSNDEMDLLVMAEEAEQARVGVLKAISEERLTRASKDEAAKEAEKEAEEYAQLATEMSDDELAGQLEVMEEEGLRGILQTEVEQRAAAAK